MSLFNDDRRYSDDPDEYLAWKAELERECRKEGRDQKEYEEDKESSDADN